MRITFRQACDTLSRATPGKDSFGSSINAQLTAVEGGSRSARFRDDVFSVSEARDQTEESAEFEPKLAAPIWEVTVDAWSEYAVLMLDTLVYKGPLFKHSLTLEWCPYVKPTVNHVPLSPLSAHTWSVHYSWP